MGASMTGACELHGGPPGWQLLPRCMLAFGWGPAWDCEGSMYMESRHRAANGWPKVNGGHETGGPEWLKPNQEEVGSIFLCVHRSKNEIDAQAYTQFLDENGLTKRMILNITEIFFIFTVSL
jgi:hypothetical protein